MSKFQLNEFAEEVQKEYQRKVEEALDRVEKIAYKKIQKIINEYMIKDYYQGYTPIEYKRTGELKKSVYPYVEFDNQNGKYGITFGIEDDWEAMDHSALHIVVKRKSKKTGKIKEYEYFYEREDPNEEAIFENFMAGIHPRVGMAGTHHIEERVNEALDYFFLFEFEDIVNKELAKIR
jgi:hypothetical protein